MSDQSTVSVDPIEEAHGSKVDRPGLKCRTVVLSDGRDWDIHVLGPSLVEDRETAKKLQMVVDAIPTVDERGTVTSRCEKRRARLLDPALADLKRLQRHYDLFTDMAEKLMKSDDPEDFKKAQEALEKSERTMNSLRGVEKRIAKIEDERETDHKLADEYGFELIFLSLETTYPGLRNVPKAQKDQLLASQEVFQLALMAVLDLRIVEPTKKNEGKPNLNGSHSQKSTSV